MYYSNFPAAPTAVVSGISATCIMPTIVDARCGRDNSLFLTIHQSEEYRLNAALLNDIASFCGVEPEDVDVLPDEDDAELLAICICGTHFDFSAVWLEQERAAQALVDRIDALQEKIKKLIRDSRAEVQDEEE